MIRFCFVPALILTMACLFGQSTPAADPVGKRPHIVFILSDDMGWAQPGFNGGFGVSTPHMDRLAAEGTRLAEFYTHSVCAPTRAAFLTGRYAFRTWSDWRTEDFGKPSYLAKLNLTLAQTASGEPTRRIHALDTGERTIAEALKESGYFTAMLGKWHLGEWLPEHLPMGQGFDYQYGHYGWGIDYYTKTIVHNAPARFAVYDWHRNQQPVQEFGYSTDLIAEEAVQLIEARSKEDQPFFMYVAFNAVHGPLNPPPGFEGEADESGALRGAMLTSLDNAIGKVMAALKRTGLDDDTLVVFANDNGPVLEEMSRPFRGTKNTTFEGGVRQPAVIRWPGYTKPGTTVDGLSFISDFFPTFISIAGGNHQQERAIDGIDMTSVWFGAEKSARKEIVFDVEGSVRLPTIRSGDFKLMGEALYNIRLDPAEQTDVAAMHPRIVSELHQKLRAYAKERPPLGEKPHVMDPALPWVYGANEQRNIPAWLKSHVSLIRAAQPQDWGPGETPWPKAPQGANASKMDGLRDEAGAGKP